MESNIQERISRISKALTSGNCESIEFSQSGDYMRFLIREEKEGDEFTTSMGLELKYGLPLIKGFRFKQHENKSCF